MHLSAETQDKILRRVNEKLSKMEHAPSATERQKMVAETARELLTEQLEADIRDTIGKAAAISPEAKGMAIRELQAGTPLKDVQRKLLDLAGVTPEAGKATQGQDQPLSLKDMSLDEFCDGFKGSYGLAPTALTSTPPSRDRGNRRPFRSSNISDDEFLNAFKSSITSVF